MSLPSRLDRAAFLQRFAAVWEHSPWIAEGAFDRGLGSAQDTAEGLHAAMVQVMRAAGQDAKMALIQAHPTSRGSSPPPVVSPPNRPANRPRPVLIA